MVNLEQAVLCLNMIQQIVIFGQMRKVGEEQLEFLD